jgi:hypothetical protein
MDRAPQPLSEPHPGEPRACPFCGRPIRLVRLAEGELIVLDLAAPVYFVGSVQDGGFTLATRLWSGHASHAAICTGTGRAARKPTRGHGDTGPTRRHGDAATRRSGR